MEVGGQVRGGRPDYGDVCGDYVAVEADILPLTGFVGDEGKIRVFVSLLDRFGAAVKGPAVFRFELYERVLRSSEPRGRRLAIWDDIDLVEAEANQGHWRDYLRAYEFELDFESGKGASFILEVTCVVGGEGPVRFGASYVLAG